MRTSWPTQLTLGTPHSPVPCRSARSLPRMSRESEASTLPHWLATRQFAGTSSVKKSKGSRRPDPIPTIHEDRVSTEPSALKSLQLARFQSGRPDLNRGPHRPEFWAKSGRVVRSTCKSMGSGLGSPPLKSADIAVDSRGFGREIDSLPNDEDADAGSLVISRARCAATARAALQVPNRRVTTLAAGHSPSARRATASPPRRRAWVRDQSYDDGSPP